MRKSTEQIAQGINKSIINSVGKDIARSRVEVSEEQKPLDVSKFYKSRAQQRQIKKQEQKFHQIIRKKQQLESELSRIKQAQAEVKGRRTPQLGQSEQGKTKCFRSTITAEQKMKISQIIKETNKFEKQAAEKTVKLMEKLSKMEEEELKEKQRRQRELSEEKRKEIIKNMEQIKQRKQERTKTINHANQQFQKVSKHKFLYQQIQDKWRILQATEEEENQKMLAKRVNEKKFNANEIKAHSRRYSEIVNAHKIQREESNKKIRQELVKQSRMVHYPSSTFFKTISEEEQIKRRTQMEKTHRPHVFRVKKTMYAETVRQKNNKPNRKESPPQDTHRIDIRSAKSLDNLSKFKLGNDYMRQMHSCIKDVPASRIQGSVMRREQDVFKYPDYLTENRKNREAQNPEQESQDIAELKKIIKNKNDDNSTRLLRAKMVAQRMDEKNNGSSQRLVQTINAKLSIIEQFSSPIARK